MMYSRNGITAALCAAVLFGASTPFAKLLLADMGPWLTAGLLYLGAGLGLGVVGWLRGGEHVHLGRGEWPWLAGAVISGGLVGPVLLMWGLAGTPASTASLLLNAEAVLTAVLAWGAFRENVDRRVFLGMVAIVFGAVVLSSWSGDATLDTAWPSLAVVGACLCWAIDNNLTRKVSLADPLRIVAIKGIAAGGTNVGLALAMGADLPPPQAITLAAGVGFLGYGLSLAAFVIGLRELGTARTGAYFSLAPFVGAAMAVPLLGEPVTVRLLSAGVLMGVGVWLHLTERHEHEHDH